MLEKLSTSNRLELNNFIKKNLNFLENKIIGLIGNLGSGKTTFVQELAKLLNIKETVNSPTFNVMKVYDNLVHLDIYNKIDSLDQYEDYFINNTVAIEWAELAKNIISFDVLIYIEEKNGIYHYEMRDTWK
ncbi:tRNA threonylcarbamoyladenosine biosynthesis protein TsaE [Mycoplasma testudineum]|uniref:tRNA threonylcarbamoyladenosine biosynthesis protein TsaE n=1 Tax=Mycoplasma testudineum TaxID=244584 RepID=A0A4R6I9W8_9MOLU|nr:tRNA (adenosine(37)-N6)-threonylcarbamoyltransferase complex ATPase subunit type 1 TsaE [Mycoplasma testudineum]OYD26467.1 tRNA (adenosine(37)-N6)-threonylcarbamoyltransferase complex ATPase subunit type 1 TsaE [Mycoplasma testudineum]TDO18970.1 tRNA threonylcarbamoyladenosine biosynthesis protein TsaE [Mycoplasma testudineum]